MKDFLEKQSVTSEGDASPERDFDGEIFLWKVLQPICEQIAAVRGRVEDVGKIMRSVLEPMKRVKMGASMVSELIFGAILGRLPSVTTSQFGGGSGLAGRTLRSDGDAGRGGRDVDGSYNRDVLGKH